MNRTEYESLEGTATAEPAIRADYFDPAPRTLLYGYTTTRATFHVYMDAGRICKAVYDYDDKPHAVKREVWDHPDELIPNKRLYAESCDYEFVRWLREHGYSMTFLPFDDERFEKVKGKQFHGEIDAD